MTGRPSDFTQEMADAICEKIASGQSLRSICRAPRMPHMSTVFRWLAARDAFREQYAQAREVQAETDADEISAIGRATLKGKHDPQAAKVAIDALKWSASKKAPRKYGDKIEHQHSGGVTIVAQDHDEAL